MDNPMVIANESMRMAKMANTNKRNNSKTACICVILFKMSKTFFYKQINLPGRFCFNLI